MYCSDLSTDADTGVIEIVPRPAHTRITEPTFAYHATRYLRRRDVRKLLEGHEWELKHRELTSGAREGVFGPCVRYEIDSTVADVWLVCRYNRRQLIGRPIVYLVVDTWSRMIVGFHIALHGPSWDTASLALISAFSPKLELLRALGIEDADETTWPSQELCLEVTSDRGEVLTRNAQSTLQSQLSIGSRVVKGGRGDAKAVVERRFGTLNTKLAWVPGAYSARMKEADLEKRRNPFDARLDLSQFTAIILGEILECNNNTHYDDLLLPQMRVEGVESTPRSMYLWGIKRRTGEMVSQKSIRELYLIFLPKKLCTIDRDGIHFRANQRYLAPRDLPELASRRRGATGSAGRVEVAYYPNDPTSILVRNSVTGVWETAALNPEDAKRIPGLTDDEVLDMNKGDAVQEKTRQDTAAKHRSRTTRRQQKIIDDATSAFASAPPAESKRAVKANTKKARAQNARQARTDAHNLLLGNKPALSQPAMTTPKADRGSANASQRLSAKIVDITSARRKMSTKKD